MAEKIQMVDLGRQMAPIRKELDEAMRQVLDNTAFINGPEVKAFSEELSNYLGGAHVVPCGNGTDGLQIAMMALGLQAGDEVIVPVFTYVATAEVIALLQLKPVFIDVDPDTFMIDEGKLEEVLTPKTRAIVPVHLFGQCANMSAIMDFSQSHHLYVIEDVAQAIGAKYKGEHAGTIGHIGVTSFFPSKNLGCYGDGGALYTKDAELAEKIRIVANHGQRVKYYHDVVGVNSRLDTLQAAILRVKLPHLDEYIENRQKAAAYYDEALATLDEVEPPKRAKDSTHVFHQYTLKVPAEKRDALREYLSEREIPSMIYYPVPLHMQKAYAGLAKEGDFPVTESLCKEVISIPMHTELREAELEFISESIKSFFKNG